MWGALVRDRKWLALLHAEGVFNYGDDGGTRTTLRKDKSCTKRQIKKPLAEADSFLKFAPCVVSESVFRHSRDAIAGPPYMESRAFLSDGTLNSTVKIFINIFEIISTSERG